MWGKWEQEKISNRIVIAGVLDEQLHPPQLGDGDEKIIIELTHKFYINFRNPESGPEEPV